MMPTPAAF